MDLQSAPATTASRLLLRWRSTGRMTTAPTMFVPGVGQSAERPAFTRSRRSEIGSHAISESAQGEHHEDGVDTI